MTAVLQLALPEHDHSPVLPQRSWALLNRLRFHASGCRASAHLALFGACALFDPQADRAEEAHARLLIRVLGEALGARPVFYRPNEQLVSFDERWLMAAIDAKARGDTGSFAFLMASRVAKSRQREFAMLLAGLAEATAETV